MRSFILSSVALALLCGGCSDHHNGSTSPARTTSEEDRFEEAAKKSLAWIRGTNPEKEAERAFEAGDHQFLGFMGVGAICPGVSREMQRLHGVRYVEGTSDAIASKAQEKLVRLVSDYCLRYNQRMLLLLGQKMK